MFHRPSRKPRFTLNSEHSRKLDRIEARINMSKEGSTVVGENQDIFISDSPSLIPRQEPDAFNGILNDFVDIVGPEKGFRVIDSTSFEANQSSNQGPRARQQLRDENMILEEEP